MRATSSRTSASGQVIRHATPRTITEGDVALYTALYGPRFAINSSDEFARGIGLPRAPVDDILAFHMVFGKTVPDVSLNAVANLGYANGKFGMPVFPGDTIYAYSEVLEKLELPGRSDAGALRVRLVATKNKLASEFPYKKDGKYNDVVVLDLDYTVTLPR